MPTTQFATLPVSQTLSFDSLLALIKGDILAIRISQFIPPETCLQWKRDIQQSVGLSNYINAQDVHIVRSGMTLFETENQQRKIKRYLKSAEKTDAKIEGMLNGGNPLKTLRSRLGQAWTAGCNLKTYKGRNMNPGILRAFEAHPEGGLPPHIDSLLKDLPDDPSLRDIRCQLAANLYIATGDSGGSLELWDFMPTEAELPSLFNGHHDFIVREKIPCQPIVIEPQMGELILFRSTCVHAVQPIRTGIRIASASFVGFYGENEPLQMWI